MPPPQHVMPTMPAFSHTLIQGCILAAENFHPFPSTCYLGDCVTRETHSTWHWNTPPSDMGRPSETESSVLGFMGINHLESLMEVHLTTRPTTSSSLCAKFENSDLTSLNTPMLKSVTAILNVWSNCWSHLFTWNWELPWVNLLQWIWVDVTMFTLHSF